MYQLTYVWADQESREFDVKLAATTDRGLYRIYGQSIREGHKHKAIRTLSEIDRRGLNRYPDLQDQCDGGEGCCCCSSGCDCGCRDQCPVFMNQALQPQTC